MQIIGLVRILRRRWLLVVPGLVVALLVALSVLYRVSLAPPALESRDQASGVATARMVMTANDRPAFDLDSRVSSTVGERASLVADLAATDVVKGRIAGRAGVDPRRLAILGPAAEAPEVPVPIATEATAAAALARENFFVRVESDPAVPIISIRASAPDAATAVRVADAVRWGIEGIVRERSGPKPAVVVRRLGPVLEETVVSGPEQSVAGIAAVLVLGFWCAGVVLMGAMTRRLRKPRGHAASA